jgi:hypothetical protein
MEDDEGLDTVVVSVETYRKLLENYRKTCVGALVEADSLVNPLREALGSQETDFNKLLSEVKRLVNDKVS